MNNIFYNVKTGRIVAIFCNEFTAFAVFKLLPEESQRLLCIRSASSLSKSKKGRSALGKFYADIVAKDENAQSPPR